MDIPPEARLALFPGFLVRGGVIRVEQYPFLHQGPRDKYLVLLNRHFPLGGTIYCAITTSQTQGLPFPDLWLILPRGAAASFPVETAINCREVHAVEFGFLANRYAAGRLDFREPLGPDVLAQIDEILSRSPYLAPAIAREIL